MTRGLFGQRGALVPVSMMWRRLETVCSAGVVVHVYMYQGYIAFFALAAPGLCMKHVQVGPYVHTPGRVLGSFV